MASQKTAGKINQLEREKKLLQTENDKLKSEGGQTSTKLETHTRREKGFMNQIGWLMDSTRRESKRLVLEKYVGIRSKLFVAPHPPPRKRF